MKILHHAEGKGLRPALRWSFSMLYLVVWSIGIGLVSLHFASVTQGWELFFGYFGKGLLVLLNLLPPLLLALLLFGLTNRVWPAVLGSGAVVLFASFANYFLLMTRSETLIAKDLRYVREAAGISSRYHLTLTPAMWACIAVLAAATVAAVFLTRARFKKWLPRGIFLALVLAIGAGAWFGLYSSDRIYEQTENLDVEFRSGYVLNRWIDTDQYISRGFLYPFLHSAKELGTKRPAGYSRGKAAAALAAYPSEDIPAGKQISVISVMLEAYCDLSVYPQLKIGAAEDDPYDFFHRLQAESIHGNLLTNIFAGGTIDTERCFISASSTCYEYRTPADSYARWFRAQGYRTEFCHAGLDWFYNRKNVAEYLGFEQSYFGNGWFENYCTTVIPDDADFFPALLSMYRDSVAAGEPYFNFSVTYQNHGPYASDSLADPGAVYLDSTGMSEESSCILGNYLDGIRRTGDALEGFIGALRESEEPTVVILFGDHKPWLGDNAAVYDEVGIDVKWQTDQSLRNMYTTQYVIWANDAAKQTLGNDFCGDGGEISPCFLMLKLFDACGWAGDGNMAALRELYGQMDVIHELCFCKDGHNLSELSGEAGRLLEQYRDLEYYRMSDAVR